MPGVRRTPAPRRRVTRGRAAGGRFRRGGRRDSGPRFRRATPNRKPCSSNRSRNRERRRRVRARCRPPAERWAVSLRHLRPLGARCGSGRDRRTAGVPERFRPGSAPFDSVRRARPTLIGPDTEAGRLTPDGSVRLGHQSRDHGSRIDAPPIPSHRDQRINTTGNTTVEVTNEYVTLNAISAPN